MKEMNDLIYTLEINYTNSSGVNTSIVVKLNDNGTEKKSIKVGNIGIEEETINGRILSGRFDNSDGYCGYRYDYENGENILNINPKISLNTAISLINKTKMQGDFLTAKLVLSSILRNDYSVVILNKGYVNIIKTITAKNEKSEDCSVQECIDLLKLDGDECLVEQYKEIIYKINEKYVVDEGQPIANNEMKSQLKELSDIISQNPQNYKQLIELQNKIVFKEL